jgi:hypothetical protein
LWSIIRLTTVRASTVVKNLKRDAVEQMAQARLAADLAAADVARRHAEREAMLVAELTQPIDETSDPE